VGPSLAGRTIARRIDIVEFLQRQFRFESGISSFMNAAHVSEGVLTMIMKNLRRYKKYNIYLDKYDTQFAKKIDGPASFSLYTMFT
jgi:hypothetical protein